jgi:hypothetical protein
VGNHPGLPGPDFPSMLIALPIWIAIVLAVWMWVFHR